MRAGLLSFMVASSYPPNEPAAKTADRLRSLIDAGRHKHAAKTLFAIADR
jgi:hypothetical protein